MKKDECRCCAVICGERFDGKKVLCEECRGSFAVRENFTYYCLIHRMARHMVIFLSVFPVFVVLAAFNGFLRWWSIPVNAIMWLWSLWLYSKKVCKQVDKAREDLFLHKLAG